MTAIAIPTRKAAIGGISLHPAGAITASAADTAVFVDKCPLMYQMEWTAIDIASTNELYIVVIEANTLAAATTWNVIGQLAVIGATASVASSGDATATGQIRAAFDNPYNNQVRVHAYLSGTTPSIDFTVKVYPLKDISVYG